MAKVVIIGAGLTSLSLAHHLEKNNFFDYQIFERGVKPGGLLQSFSKDGFTIDQTGHFLHASDLRFASFLQEVLGESSVNAFERSSFIFFKNQFIPYPFQQNIGYLSDEVAFECLEGFINRNQSCANPQNFLEWVLKYYGSGFAKYFFCPYNEKLLNSKAKDISHSWTSRFVPNVDLRQLFNSLRGNTNLGAGYNAKFIYPKVGGIQTLIQKIVSRLSRAVSYQKNLIEIDADKKEVVFADGTKEKYDLLVTTAPLPNTLESLKVRKDLYEQAKQNLRCNSVYNFNFGVDQLSESKMHWIYFPEEQFKFYRAGLWHHFSPAMAPTGCSSFYGEISFLPNGNWDCNLSEIKEHVEKSILQIKEIFGVPNANIIFRHDQVLSNAYVIYDAWRETNLPIILSCLKKEDILSIGRFGEWKYSSMQEAYFDGLSACQFILEFTKQ